MLPRRLGRQSLALAAVAAAGLAAAPAQARSRYALANKCFAAGDAGTFFFKPTALGRYMLWDGKALLGAAQPGPDAEWIARRGAGGRLTLRSPSSGSVLRGPFTRRRGCDRYPEAQLDASGTPFKGTRRDGTVRGWADAHVHITADMRAGGRTIYGESFDPYGITEALGHDEDEHGPNGTLDFTGNLLHGDPARTHDNQGWPGFTGWPTFDTFTHQQVYYRWLQRAWLAGLRLAVAQVVEDQPLCTIEPQRSHSCDETDTIRLEVERLRALERYVDAQSGGPGRGWFRLVYDPAQARRVVERGKLAVLIGVESSNLFGCSELAGQPQCDRAAVDRGLVLFHHLGIRALFITHWVDNAFGGAALEGGDKGTFIGAFQVAQTGLPFMTGPCPEEGQGDSCNSKGLTELGEYLLGRMMDDHMLIEADHLSERARLDAFALAEARNYPLLSSHTNTGGFWTAQDLDRLRALGGFATARPDAAGQMAQRAVELGSHGFAGVGVGTDTGGFAAMPGPDPGAAKDPLPYPYRLGGVSFGRQRTGTRTFDLNADGVAHYGLLPDLIADMRRRPHGRRATRLLFGSAEAYLRAWERAAGT